MWVAVRLHLMGYLFLLLSTKTPSASSQEIQSIILKSECTIQVLNRTSDLGTLKVVNKTKKPCIYFVKTLSKMARDVLVFNTKEMECKGGAVSFPNNARNMADYCNETACIAYYRRALNESITVFTDVNATIVNAFPECKQYQIIKKPSHLKFKAARGTTSFVLEYKLFNISIMTTTGTITRTVPQNGRDTTATDFPHTSATMVEKRTTQQDTTETDYETTKNSQNALSTGTWIESADNTTNGKGRENQNGEPEAWHYALPISLVSLTSAGLSIFFVVKRRNGRKGNKLTESKYYAAPHTVSKEQDKLEVQRFNERFSESA